jgi:peroxiredoxin
MPKPARTIALAAAPAVFFGMCVAGCESTGSTNAQPNATGSSTTSQTVDVGPNRLASGDRVPGVTVRNARDQRVQLDHAVRENGKTVLIFYRGGWCPYCNEQLVEWQDNLSQLRSMGYSLVAITPEAPDDTAATLENNELEFTILSDAQHDAAEAFGIDFMLDERTVDRYRGFGINLDESNASGEWRLAHRGTYVIDADGTIRRAWVLEDYRTHTPAQEVLREIATLKG